MQDPRAGQGGLFGWLQETPGWQAIFGNPHAFNTEYPDYMPDMGWFQQYAPTAGVSPESLQRMYEFLPGGLSQAYTADIEQMAAINQRNQELYDQWGQFMTDRFNNAGNIYAGIPGSAF